MGKQVRCPECSTVCRVPRPPSDPLAFENQEPSQHPSQDTAPEDSSPKSQVSLPSLDKPAIDVKAIQATAKAAQKEKEQRTAETRRQSALLKGPQPNSGQSSTGESSRRPSGRPESKATPNSIPNRTTHSNGPVKRSIFDDDLPELSKLESSLTSNPSTAVPTEILLDGDRDLNALDELIPQDVISNAPTKLAPLFDDPKNHLDEYRVICGVCGTPQYIKFNKQGTKIKCPDCFHEFRAPPRPEPKKTKVVIDTSTDVRLAPSGNKSGKDSDELQRSRAARILEKAEAEASEDELEDLYYGTDFDTAGFLKRTFGFLTDAVAVAHLIGFGIIFSGIFVLGQWAANGIDDGWGRGYLLLSVVGIPLLAFIVSLPLLTGGLALLESVANGQLRVKEWPSFSLFDHLGDALAIGLSLVASLLPGLFLSGLIAGEEPGSGRIQIMGMMLSAFFLFPFLLLSVLDNGSLMQPISGSVIRSLTEAKDAWGGYFLKTLVGFVSILILWYVLLGNGKPLILSAIAGMLFPLLILFTCQQIGVLAGQIADYLSFDIRPANDQDADISQSVNGDQE